MHNGICKDVRDVTWQTDVCHVIIQQAKTNKLWKEGKREKFYTSFDGKLCAFLKFDEIEFVEWKAVKRRELSITRCKHDANRIIITESWM